MHFQCINQRNMLQTRFLCSRSSIYIIKPSTFFKSSIKVYHTPNMGNCLPLPVASDKVLPIETTFKLPSGVPTWPRGGGFATGTISLQGGLEVCQISTFTKVWSTREGGPGDLGATFYEPSPVPAGFSMLGCYGQPNNTPLFGWVLAAKDDSGESLKMPVDYTLVWSSQSVRIKQDGVGYIWLPTSPDGYRAVGHVVTSSPEKPPLNKIRCIRSDLTEQCERDQWIWGEDEVSNSNEFGVYGLKPTNRGTQALGVCVGTFIAQVGQADTPLACLKNGNLNLSAMPNLSQIQALVQAYSPWIYFHPDEKYFPCSVNWFFNNGALLYKKDDESNPVRIEPNGSNLPQGGSNDVAYWLDLPVDQTAKDQVKKGHLQSSGAYVHVKPMLGATFTDIVLWVFYPFNGPGTVKVGLINVPLGRTGEHIGDWEHLTLRISNFTGGLWRVYFSQHSKGSWVDASELEFQGGNKVVAYASFSGHAFYSKPGLVLQGATGIGIRNDTAKSKIVIDTGMRSDVVSAEYLGTAVVEPPWLNYAREWGPKISYEITEELEKVKKVFPSLKTPLEGLVKILPSELFGEEGPTGPKMKSSWNGDER